MKYKIGIVGWNTGDNSFGASKSYLTYLRQYGEVHIITPEQEVREDLDLLVLPGGADVDTTRYGELPEYYTTNPNMILEYFDRVRLPEYINNGQSILGICRGMQSLGVYFGAKLIQEIGGHPYSTKSRSELVHKVWIYDSTIPKDLLETKGAKGGEVYIETNSLHHQAIDMESLGNTPIKVIGVTKEVGADVGVEIIKIQGHNIIGVQFHPKFFGALVSNN